MELPGWFSNKGLLGCLWFSAGAAVGIAIVFAYVIYSAIEHIR